MMKRQKSRGERAVIIAVKASREISRNALIWALTHVVQPGDCVKLLVLIPAASTSSHKLWKFNSDCATGKWKNLSGQKEDITEICSQMMLQFHNINIYDSDKIKMKIKVISSIHFGEVAGEAKKTQTKWVVLDKNLKKEAKACIEELDCNVVVMKNCRPRILRLNLMGSPSNQLQNINSISCPQTTTADHIHSKEDENITKVPNVTPVSSPEHSSFTASNNTSSLSSSDIGFIASDHDWVTNKDDESESDFENMSSSPLSFCSSGDISLVNPITHALGVKFSDLDLRPEKSTTRVSPSTFPLTKHLPPKSPALCSICRHKAPVFGKPPKLFSFTELEDATGGFSKSNLLAEGGFGWVYRGVLKDGRMVAVKQHKMGGSSPQGDNEFFSEVDVLSCAQHRNVVMLIGFCVEDCRRLLVYEYICNGSLDSHLYGQGNDDGVSVLEWCARRKIAIGAARGLRYLHEECRVGCIVHRDVRPNNILLTHDFEALLGDFGLARWQPDTGVETRIYGTFGYMAPEYAQSGEITEKADVYSFGVLLVELITGRKAIDMNRPKGQQYLTQWARPLLEETAITELIDMRLRDSYSKKEVECMSHCASLCIRRDPHLRPRMSQVLWLLENNNIK